MAINPSRKTLLCVSNGVRPPKNRLRLSLKMDRRNQILQKYNVSFEAQIGRGMEAEVYDYRGDTVLKLYVGTATFDDLVILKDFYKSLARDRLPYQLPHIYAVTQESGHHVVTIEQKLRGRPLSSVLSALSNDELDGAMQEYLSVVLALANIDAPTDHVRLKLFDPYQLSNLSHGDWHHFLRNHLNHKLLQVAPYLERDVTGFSGKLTQLHTILASPYEGNYKLIHGDFCPENVLIDDQNRAIALIDFGLLTMYGDHLFDVATGWLFFDMYDELKAKVYDRFLAIALEAIGHDQRATLYRYILIYSILSANSYSTDCKDGHYQWCVANLSNRHYWKYLS